MGQPGLPKVTPAGKFVQNYTRKRKKFNKIFLNFYHKFFRTEFDILKMFFSVNVKFLSDNRQALFRLNKLVKLSR